MFPLLRSTVVFRGGARPIQSNEFKIERLIHKSKIAPFRFLRTVITFSTFKTLNPLISGMTLVIMST